jgi:hypothetical protein
LTAVVIAEPRTSVAMADIYKPNFQQRGPGFVDLKR